MTSTATSPNLVAALEATVHRVLERLGAELEHLGLTHGEINTLYHLDGDAPRSVAALLDATGQRPSTLTGILNRLERRELLVREINPRDRRSFVLRTTPAGAEAVDEIRAAFARLEVAVLAELPAGTRPAFMQTLAAVDAASARIP
jgi:DNA-binding MarR family transcriptional regulator